LDAKNEGVKSIQYVALATAMALAPAAHAKEKKPKEAPKDEIQVVAHVPLTDGPVRRFLLTQHYSRIYVYAERDPGKSVTLLDVTKPAAPSVLAELANAPGDSANFTLVAGTAALVSSEPAATPQTSQTIRIMDFSDPKNPKVAREFVGVTAMSRDDRRGIVLIANGEGIWILRESLATDPAVEEEYDRYLRYGTR
jgi:hypothetical protein